MASGVRYLSPPLTERALEAYVRRAGGEADPYDTLTAREREVLVLAAENHSNADIAARLYISRRTGETHRARAMRKLGLRGHVDLVLFGVCRGIVADDTTAPRVARSTEEGSVAVHPDPPTRPWPQSRMFSLASARPRDRADVILGGADRRLRGVLKPSL